MKKINQYIIAAAIPFLGMLAACTDGNDWTVDNSASRQRTPDGLEAEIDSATLNMELKWNKASGATGYEVQVSESPLMAGIDETEGIATFSTDASPMTIDRINDKIQIKENTTYYVRVRAIQAGKNPSKWATDDIASGTYKVQSPATLWIDDTGVGEKDLTMQWIKTKYATPTTIVNQNTGESHEITDEEKEALSYKATGLQDGVEYTFTLLDENGNQIGKTTKATEKAPNMDWAMSVMDLSTWVKGGITTLTSGKFTVEMNDHGGKFKGEFKDIRMISPLNETGEKLSFYRFNTNTKEFYSIDDWDPETSQFDPNKSKEYIKLTIPAKGRLYVYAYTGTAGRTMVVAKRVINPTTNEMTEEKIFDKALDSNLKDNAPEGDAVKYEKIYITEAGDYYVSSPSGAIYIYGFIFVPDEEIKQDPIDVIN